jgi:hypothetical protein
MKKKIQKNPLTKKKKDTKKHKQKTMGLVIRVVLTHYIIVLFNS